MRALRFAIVSVLLAASACVPLGNVGQQGSSPPDAKLVWKSSHFAELDGWASADQRAAFRAFKASCNVIVAKKDEDPVGGDPSYGTAGAWRQPCQTALQIEVTSETDARQFFETWFQPVQVLNREEPVGLFTGYYEPQLNGSRKPSRVFNVPLNARPADLVQVDLGTFRPALKGERVAGRVDGGKLVPYATRAQIVSGALGSLTRPVVYVDSAIDAFFLEVQGSGRVKLEDGSMIRVAIDGQNGHPYTGIGRVLLDRGEIAKGQLSMQSIRAWLDANPGKAQALMNENASYVFFKEQPIADPSVGADGAQGVPLTPEGSVAVDLKFHALGAPVWIDAHAPAAEAGQEDVVFQRLFVMQDTGGAIRGPVRADVYWGAGKTAESIAGRMAHKGRMYVLLPKPVAAGLN